MQNFKKFGGMGACQQYGEMYTSRTFLDLVYEQFLSSLYRKNN